MSSLQEFDGANAPSEDGPYRGRRKPIRPLPSDMLSNQKPRRAHEKCACWWRGCTTLVNCYSRVVDTRVAKLLGIAFGKEKKPHLCAVHEVAVISAVYLEKPNTVLARWMRLKMRRPVTAGNLRLVS